MQTKQYFALLALTANGALAANHGHVHHHEKKAIVYEATETVTDVSWVTVTVGEGGATVGATTTSSIYVPTQAPSSPSSSATPSTSSTTSSSTLVASSAPTTTSVAPSTTSVAPTTTSPATTLVTSTKATSAAASSTYEPIVNIALTTSSSSTSTYVASSAAATSTSVASSGTSSGNKRGAAYNTASLISPLIGSGSKLSWAYNWGSSSDGLSDVSSDLEFVPMLWGSSSDFTSVWSSAAESAIASGSSHLLSFNEPDNSGQSNLSPSEAATAHQTYMNPLSGKASIGAPAITNSNIAGESTDWLSEWISACGGSCDFDFCPAHWYNTIDAGADDLLSFVKEVYDTCGEGKTVWITEFEPTDGSDEEKASFLSTVQEAFDSDEYSFIERYSYFMVADGNLVNGDSASTFGSTFAYS